MRTHPILSNPEFQRNIWQELTQHRLIGGLVILSVLAWLSYLTSFPSIFYWVTIGIIFIWGIKSASVAIQEECQQGTWDYQRISVISPFKFTWGKLLGSTSYTWYLASISFIFFLVLGLYFKEPLNLLLQQYFILVLCGLLGQYIALIFSLNALQFGRDKQYSFKYFIGALIFSSLLASILSKIGMLAFYENYHYIKWYGFNFQTYAFGLIFAVILLYWSILGSYYLIRAEFQYKNKPYVWLSFCLFWIVYLAGFESISLNNTVIQNFTTGLNDWPVSNRLYVGFFTAWALLYISLFSQKYQIIGYKKLFSLIQEKKYLTSLSVLPRWAMASIFFTFLCFGIALFGNINIELNGEIIKLETTALSSPKIIIQGYVFGATALLLSTRDILLVHFLYFARNSKRAALSTTLYLVLLYFVLPALFLALNLQELNTMLLPSYKNLGLIGWTGLLAQVGLLAWLVRNRFIKK